MRREKVILSDKSGKETPDFRIIGLSAPVRLAIEALAVLAKRPSVFVQVQELAKGLNLPAASLSKSFQALTRCGLLTARRGPGGGYVLAQDPACVTLASIVAALGAEDSQRGRCLMSERPCASDKPCLLHFVAAEANRLIHSEMARLTLLDMT